MTKKNETFIVLINFALWIVGVSIGGAFGAFLVIVSTLALMSFIANGVGPWK
jgi:hypothetical protein